MGNQTSELMHERVGLLSKVFGDADKTVLSQNAEYLKSLYKEDKAKAFEEYFAFIDKLRKQDIPCSSQVESLGRWIDKSGVTFIDYRNRYIYLLGSIYGEESAQYIRELGLFAQDCFAGKQYSFAATLLERKKVIGELDPSECNALFDSYYEQKQYSDAFRIGNEAGKQIAENSNPDFLAVFYLHFIESCYFSDNKTAIVKVIDSLADYGKSLDYLYNFIDGDKKKFGNFSSYIYTGFMCSESVDGLKISAIRCFSCKDYIKKSFFTSALKDLKDFVDNWKDKNGFLLFENSPTEKTRAFIEDFSSLFKIVFDHLNTCKDRGSKVRFDLLLDCFEFIRYTRSIQYVSLKLSLLSLLIQCGLCPKDCADPFELYHGIVNTYSNGRDIMLNSSWIDFAIGLGDFTYEYISDLSRALNVDRKTLLEKINGYYSDAEEWNDSFKVYFETDMRVLLENQRAVVSELQIISERAQNGQRKKDKDNAINKTVGFIYFGCALLLSLFAMLIGFSSGNTQLSVGVGLITGCLIFVFSFFLNWTKPVYKAIIDGLMLFVIVLIRLVKGEQFAFVFSVLCASLSVVFIGSWFSCRCKAIFGNNPFDKINILFAGLSVILLLVLGFSFNWLVWQWILGIVLGLSIIAFSVYSAVNRLEMTNLILLAIAISANFVLFFIFNSRYSVLFELVFVSIELNVLISTIWGFFIDEGMPLLGVKIAGMVNMAVIALLQLIAIKNSQSALVLFLGINWTTKATIIGLSLGLSLVFLSVIAFLRGDETILPGLSLLVFMMVNIALHFIFKSEYFTIFRILSITVEVVAVFFLVSWFLGENDFGLFYGARFGIIVGVLNLLSIILWIITVKTGTQEGVIVEEVVRDVTVASNSTVSASHNTSQWWKWPVGIIGALIIGATGFIPEYGCGIAFFLFVANGFLLMKNGYPGGYDVFFKCFTFGIGFAGIAGLFHPESQKWSRVIGFLVAVFCIIIITNFGWYMEAVAT